MHRANCAVSSANYLQIRMFVGGRAWEDDGAFDRGSKLRQHLYAMVEEASAVHKLLPDEPSARLHAHYTGSIGW
jgi:hypothetical protein